MVNRVKLLARRSARRVVAVVAVLGMVGALAAAALAAPPIPIAKRKFDHDRHVSAAAASGKRAECVDCHRYDAQGVLQRGKEHARCVACHAKIDTTTSCNVLKTPGPKGIARVCEICHIAKRRECLPKDLPPPPQTASFAARFTHGKHLTLGTSIEKDCVQCHKAQAPGNPPKVASHTLCAGCHNPNGARPTMTECAQCHVAPTAKAPRRNEPYRLVQFDHRGHHRTSRQASCLGCHDKLVGAGDAALPRPSMAGCQSKCHDGQKAFSAVGTQCLKCHQGGNAAPIKTRTDVVFLHGQHGTRNVKVGNCGTCHSSQPDGRLDPPLARKDHQPCAASGCHQAEFMSRAPQICGVCHDTVAPWQHNLSRPQPVERANPEWFETIDHQLHLAKTGSENGACTSCHGEKLAGGPSPQSHDACAGCHGQGQGPSMNMCAACHTATKPVRPAVSAWSVRHTFSHPKHASDPRTRKDAQCIDCHTTIRNATTLASIRPPTMMQCDAACHNGKVSFKTTGFECARCHAPPTTGSPQPTAMLQVPR